MPLAPQRPDVLTDHRRTALLALRRPALRPLRLAVDAPGISVLLDVRLALIEGVAALGAEKVAVMPVRAQRHDVVPEDRRLAVLAAGREKFVPVEVAVEAQAIVPILRHRLARCLFQHLSRRPPPNPVKPLAAELLRFGADLEGLEACAAGVATEALRMEALRGSL